jgi:hypothetical protein
MSYKYAGDTAFFENPSKSRWMEMADIIPPQSNQQKIEKFELRLDRSMLKELYVTGRLGAAVMENYDLFSQDGIKVTFFIQHNKIFSIKVDFY